MRNLYKAGLDILGANISMAPPAKPKMTMASPVTTSRSAPAPAKPVMTKTVPSKQAVLATKMLKSAATSNPKAAAALSVAKAVGIKASAAQQAIQTRTAGNRAIAAGRKLAKFKPQAGNKLIATGQKVVQKAAQAATTVKGTTLGLGGITQSISLDSGTSPASDGSSTPSPSGPVMQMQMSVDQGALQAGIAALTESMTEVNSVAEAGEQANVLLPLIQQMTAANQTPIAQAGQAIADQYTNIVNNYDPDVGDPTVHDAVENLRSQSQAWQTQAQGALGGAGAFNPGSASGGGGGGTDDTSTPASPTDSSETDDSSDDFTTDQSSAVQQFRESGGQWDPFADDSDDGSAPVVSDSDGGDDSDDGSVDDGSSDDGTASFADNKASLDAGDAVDDTVQGLEAKDYHFEWQDLFNPAGGYYRTQQEVDAKEAADPRGRLDYNATPTPTLKQGSPSPAVAKKLAAAKAKLAASQRAAAALRYSQLASGKATAASFPTQDISTATDDSDQGGGDAVVGHSIKRMADIVMGLTQLGFDMEEANDIVIEQFQHQVTDEDHDPTRWSGSVHRGAAYLQQDRAYPTRGGSSAGREGGLIRPEQTLEIFGCAYDRGLDALGTRKR